MKVVELFAGVGGFRVGFENVSTTFFETVWANQWEPAKKVQHAYDCYVANFGTKHNCINEDIAKVKHLVPEHDLLVGGFPCQDYSVAATNAKGIEGKKGVLWWEIRDIIERCKPGLVFLENVDRLLKSPSKQRGRDFGIILRCLNDLGYSVEWRIINAAEYGHPQKRRRTLLIAYNKANRFYSLVKESNYKDVIISNGILAKAFPVQSEIENKKEIDISSNKFVDLVEFSNKFNANFENAGFMNNEKVFTTKVTTSYYGNYITLLDILDNNVEDRYFISLEELEKWKYLKGSKKELRVKPNGEPYYYTEGAIPFPDNLNCPARTILTSESSTSRTSHIILDPQVNRYRILTPEECEKINEFPQKWTDTGMTNKYRYFVMGNALVVGLIKSVAKVIFEEFNNN